MITIYHCKYKKREKCVPFGKTAYLQNNLSENEAKR